MKNSEEKRVMLRNKIKIIVMALLPLIFIICVKWMVANNPYSICFFKLLTGHDCWGCGITRAFGALFNLQFKQAVEFNPRIVIVAPLMSWIWASALISAVKSQVTQYKAEAERT